MITSVLEGPTAVLRFKVYRLGFNTLAPHALAFAKVCGATVRHPTEKLWLRRIPVLRVQVYSSSITNTSHRPSKLSSLELV